MKTRISLRILFVLLFINVCANAQTTPAIIADWMDYAGISDTLTVIPIAQDDSSNIISVGVTIEDTTTGANILISKMDSTGYSIWKKTYSSSGNNRDQPVAVTTDDKSSIYVAGVSYSSATNFDWVILKYGYDGTLIWTYTLNGTMNNYDVPAAIKVKNSFVYVTGAVYDSVTQLNYATIQLNRTTGALNWKRQYDFHSLYDLSFAMDISPTGKVTIAGASQDTPTKWNYCSVTYDSVGTAKDTTRIGGTTNSFDRPMAVKCDHFGNFYITGAASDSGASFNVKTAKVDSAGNLSWVVNFGTVGKPDEGSDVLVDDSGYVYVGGKSYNGSNLDYLLVKYSNSGVMKWVKKFDADSADDIVTKMCFDNYGNIVMTGTATRGDKDILTIAYSRAGDYLWKIYFDGEYNGDDQGTGITADANGNIFVSGESQITDSTYQKVTIKYKTDYFLVPQDTVPTPSTLLFYPNTGQIIGTDGNTQDDLYFYTIKQFPKLYFKQDSVAFVMGKIHNDTTITDSLERITMNFQDGILSDAYTDGLHDKDQVLNYFLGHCPDGITGIEGSEKIMYSSVYENTDVVFSNNSSGMKFQIIVNTEGDPSAIKLHFTGHQQLSLVSNSDLKVQGVVGSFIYERPLAYQLDRDGNRISLGWLASYNIIDSADVEFTLGGSYDGEKPLVLECARAVGIAAPPDSGLCWGTIFGGDAEEVSFGVATDNSDNQYVTGETRGSTNFPIWNAYQSGFFGLEQCFLSQFDTDHKLAWSTYLGGADDQFATDVKCNSSGEVCICGFTSSVGFPSHHHTSSYNDYAVGGVGDGFISKFSSDGQSLLWSTYFGGSGSDRAYSLDFDSNDNLYVAGYGDGSSFPLHSKGGAYNQTASAGSDAFLAEFDNNDSLVWCTFYCGDSLDWASSVKVDKNDNVFMQGGTRSSNLPTLFPGGSAFIDSTIGGTFDEYIVKFNSSGARQWASLIGGSAHEYIGVFTPPNAGNRIAFDSYNNIYIVGLTASSNFPLKHSTGFNDSIFHTAEGYIMKFNHSDYSLMWSTFVSGEGQVNLSAIAIDHDDAVYVGGSTNDTLFPLRQVPNIYYQDRIIGGLNPAYAPSGCIIAFDNANNLLYGTFIGGAHSLYGIHVNDITVHDEKLYLTGYVCGDDNAYKKFPVFDSGSGAYFDSTYSGQQDGFITMLCVDNVIGIEEITKENIHATLFPNPSYDKINLLFDLNKKEKFNFIICNNLGQTIRVLPFLGIEGKNKMQFDISSLSEGIYFLQMQGEQSSMGMKFVKIQN